MKLIEQYVAVEYCPPQHEALSLIDRAGRQENRHKPNKDRLGVDFSTEVC